MKVGPIPFEGCVILSKEVGYTLSIDQASNLAGVSLWFNGLLQAHTVLRSDSPQQVFSKRIQTQLRQLDEFLDRYLPPHAQLNRVLFEGVRARLVLVTVGAFCCAKRISVKLHPRTSFVESTSWKVWARAHGATGILKDIKGLKALKETGFDCAKYKIESDDTADSILIYLTWREAC